MNEPTYLPLLNSIAVNEAKGQLLLDAWASTTKDESLAQALRFVAIREGDLSVVRRAQFRLAWSADLVKRG